MRGAARAAATLVAGTALAAGCGAGGSSSSPAASPGSSAAASVPAVPAVPGIEAEAVRLRTDEAVGGRVQVRVTNTGTAPFTVTAVAIDSPGFAVLPTTAKDTVVDPGRTIDLPTPFGAVECGDAPDPSAARLSVVRAGEPPEELRVPLGGGTLARVHGEECAVAAVTSVVGIELTELAGPPDGDEVDGEVVLTRRAGDDPVEVSALARSVLIEVRLADELPVTLAPGEGELRLPVSFGLASCEPHVLAETKQPFVFPLSVAVGEGEPVAVDLPVGDAQRAALQELVARVCTPGG
jgi:hypothetical protein